MQSKSKLYFLTICILVLSLMSCDPGHFGKTLIRNESSYSLELKYTTHTNDKSIIIQPNSFVEVFHFGGLGSGRDYNCCSCEFEVISLQPVDTSMTMTKDITNEGNWILSDPNEKRFSNEEITCEFAVRSFDIQ